MGFLHPSETADKAQERIIKSITCGWIFLQWWARLVDRRNENSRAKAWTVQGQILWQRSSR